MNLDKQTIDGLFRHSESRSETVLMQVNTQRRKTLSFYLKSSAGLLSELARQCKRNDQQKEGWQLLRTVQLPGSCKAAFVFVVSSHYVSVVSYERF